MSDVSEAEVMLRKVGATRNNFWKPISKDEELARKVLEIAIAKPTYDVVVIRDRSLAEMIKAGNYEQVNNNITEKHFPVEGKGEHEIGIALFHFNQSIDSADVIAEMENQGYRPATIDELLALGENCPDLQREFRIIALGSVWRRNLSGIHYVISLWHRSGRRSLFLVWFVSSWHADDRFAAVRK